MAEINSLRRVQIPKAVRFLAILSQALVLTSAIFEGSLSGQTMPAPLPDVNVYSAGYVNAIAPQGDGRIILGGYFSAIDGVPRRNLARLNPDGSVDLTWNPGCDGTVYALAVDDTAVYVGGVFQQLGGQTRFGLGKVSLDGAGSADPNWDPVNESSTTVHALTLVGQELYVGGIFNRIGGQLSGALARINVLTALADPSWRPRPDGRVDAVLVDGTDVYVGGSFRSIGYGNADNLAKLDVWVGLWSDWDVHTSGPVTALASGDGYLYVGGAFDLVGGEPRQNIARVAKTKTGDVDPLWNPGANGQVRALIVQDASIFAMGDFSRIGAQERPGIAKLLAATPGIADLSWQMEPVEGVSSRITALAISGSAVYAGGNFHSVGSHLTLGLAKLDAQLGVVAEPFRALVEKPGNVNAIALQDDGTIAFGGAFDLVGDAPRFNLARLNPDRTLDTKWAPRVNGPVSALAGQGADLYVGGSFTVAGGARRNGLAKFSLSDVGALDPAWDPKPSEGAAILTLAVGPDSVYAGGMFSEMGGETRRNLARVSTSAPGSVDPLWAPDVNSELGGEIDQVGLTGDSLFVVGSFDELGGARQPGVAKLSAVGSGAADPIWGPDLGELVHAFTIVGEDIYFAGLRDVLRTQTTGVGVLDPGWHPIANDYLQTIASDGRYIYAGGDFEFIGGEPRRFIARIPIAGSGAADPSWTRPIADDFAPVLALLPTAAGVYAGGLFSAIGGRSHAGIAYLPELHAPIISSADGRVFISPDPHDGADVTYFWVTGLDGLSVSLADAATPVKIGDFLTVAQAQAGLVYSGTGTLMLTPNLEAGLGGTGGAMASVTLVNGPAELRLSQPVLLGDGTVALALHGAAKGVFSIDASADLITGAESWMPITTLTNLMGVTVFTNLPPAAAGQFFYRAKQL